ncbi:MAG: hypothetical protein R3245_11020, partial [Kiloniellales bacterium]|nr:hypothetical protein [Kiloniellales bacterium]
MDEALGLRAARGGVPWWLEEAIRKRDFALRQLAVSYFTDCSLSAKARSVALISRRYAATCWRFDRDAAEMPETYR